MLLFQPLILLLIHGCRGQYFPIALDVTPFAVLMMNGFRQLVANGTAFKMGGYLPGSSSMFQLKPSAVLNSTAQKNIIKCNASSNDIQAGQSINIYTISYLPPSITDLYTLIGTAISTWAQEPLLYGFNDTVVYNNTKLKDFANMIYYKSTEVGCYYNLCNTGPVTQAIACVFNMSPKKNQSLYIPAQGAHGCDSDEDCSKLLAGSICNKGIGDGSNTGLCDPRNATFNDTTIMGTPLNMTDAIREKITNMHNYRRSRLAQGLVQNGETGKYLPQGEDIAQLIYNKTLEKAALDYAVTCPKGLSPEKSRNNIGEIYQSLRSDTMAYMDVIKMALEASWHPIMVVGFNPNLEFEQLTPLLMFTQMAWGKTHSVGCGAARCSTNTTVICRYYPSGNIPGQKLYIPGKTCSMCLKNCTTAYLYKGLCPVQ